KGRPWYPEMVSMSIVYQTGIRTSDGDAPGNPKRICETDPIGTPRNLTGAPRTSPFTDPLKYDTSLTSWREKPADPNTSTAATASTAAPRTKAPTIIGFPRRPRLTDVRPPRYG